VDQTHLVEAEDRQAMEKEVPELATNGEEE